MFQSADKQNTPTKKNGIRNSKSTKNESFYPPKRKKQLYDLGGEMQHRIDEHKTNHSNGGGLQWVRHDPLMCKPDEIARPSNRMGGRRGRRSRCGAVVEAASTGGGSAGGDFPKKKWCRGRHVRVGCPFVTN